MIAIILSFAVFNVKDISYANELINSKDSFISSLAERQKTIYIDDIDFQEGTSIKLNYSVKIVGKSTKSELKNLHIILDAPNQEDKMISIEFENVKFNGCFDESKYSLEEGKEFEEIFTTELDDGVCINGDQGCYNLSLNNCEICSYCSYEGAAIHVGNSANNPGHKYVNINNSKFFNNRTKQGTIFLGNSMLIGDIRDSEFYSNISGFAAGIQFSNGSGAIENCKIHDNSFFNYSDLNMQNIGGGMIIGGSNMVVKGCDIYKNHTLYGGGLGIVSAQNGDGEILVENCNIYKNKANISGGGISVFSLIGQPVNIINCNVISNDAPSCGSFHIETYAGWRKSNIGGNVNILFTTIALNTSNDTNSFNYHSDYDENKGRINIKGSVIIDNDPYEIREEDYNYVSTKQDAIDSNILSAEEIEILQSEFILPSRFNTNVPASAYSSWYKDFENATEDVLIGSGDKQMTQVPTEPKSIPVITIVLSVVIPITIISASIATIVLIRRKKHMLQPVSEPENITEELKEEKAEIVENNNAVEHNPIKDRLALLTERELQVVKLTIECKKRKEIADILMYSENTIKKDITSIYQKLDVLDKMELIAKYKDFV